MIDPIAHKFRTSTQWVHLPMRHGNWRGGYNRLRMWAVDGTWGRVFTALVPQAIPRPRHRPLPQRSTSQPTPAAGPSRSFSLPDNRVMHLAFLKVTARLLVPRR